MTSWQAGEAPDLPPRVLITAERPATRTLLRTLQAAQCHQRSVWLAALQRLLGPAGWLHSLAARAPRSDRSLYSSQHSARATSLPSRKDHIDAWTTQRPRSEFARRQDQAAPAAWQCVPGRPAVSHDSWARKSRCDAATSPLPLAAFTFARPVTKASRCCSSIKRPSRAWSTCRLSSLPWPQHFQVVAIDTSGTTGKATPPPPGRWQVADYARAVLAALDALGWPPGPSRWPL
ncbi:MAG: hypothetical protein KatS3mg061_0037 [Dehalococcoidia bacterium]|nr:MAG: hypothetical protein KatS3mg061_0037 [Dehalococcoidia bacterium]